MKEPTILFSSLEEILIAMYDSNLYDRKTIGEIYKSALALAGKEIEHETF